MKRIIKTDAVWHTDRSINQPPHKSRIKCPKFHGKRLTALSSEKLQYVTNMIHLLQGAGRTSLKRAKRREIPHIQASDSRIISPALRSSEHHHPSYHSLQWISSARIGTGLLGIRTLCGPVFGLVAKSVTPPPPPSICKCCCW